MNITQIEERLRHFVNWFDYTTLSDRSNDPYILVSWVSASGQIQTSSHFLTEGSQIHNRLRTHICLARAMEKTAEMICNIPFKQNMVYKGIYFCLGIPMEDGYLVITVITSNETDAEKVARKVSNLF